MPSASPATLMGFQRRPPPLAKRRCRRPNRTSAFIRPGKAARD
ncbi:hypothetical protein NBRC3257_2437 [Gluconobacter thailandicus NBRC 3257]|uniref:Uncharacterized protein n=1 Tax=Gluconobacter thailandicus NBRC 3257 TaxID=1381097 RepID=A0ABQ0IZ19_GLUTH|nr:hypothetical protein B932_3479 [Gluconobacter oxydans H24]GAC87042.1 hypothetical protein NBRC3255_0703 [Gluconobacter thailandicus NBRC 3255]GAD27437.1 hypothetical protein NBRC3257_2437 [Gluconobacter thailandicus NBRC 3257]